MNEDKKVKVKFDIPKEISYVVADLEKAGFEAWLVGGCVRDLFLGVAPKDWDVTTDATPEEIQKVFDHTFYENDFGTVGVVNDKVAEKVEILEKEIESLKEQKKNLKKDLSDAVSSSADVIAETVESLKKEIEKKEDDLKKMEILKMVEVTPYRIESAYSDGRHPDEVKFSKNLEDDLKRRDFTINALCYNPKSTEVVDLFSGISDLQKKEIRAIGSADKRFGEDALRVLRAIRFSAQLGFSIEKKTAESILKNHFLLEKVSNERIRDEFVKILLTDNPVNAFFLAKDLKVLKYISADLERGIGVEQNGAHRYDVFEHLLRTMQHSADRKWSLDVRLASLFHDISKPETRRWSKEKNN